MSNAGISANRRSGVFIQWGCAGELFSGTTGVTPIVGKKAGAAGALALWKIGVSAADGAGVLGGMPLDCANRYHHLDPNATFCQFVLQELIQVLSQNHPAAPNVKIWDFARVHQAVQSRPADIQIHA